MTMWTFWSREQKKEPVKTKEEPVKKMRFACVAMDEQAYKKLWEAALAYKWEVFSAYYEEGEGLYTKCENCCGHNTARHYSRSKVFVAYHKELNQTQRVALIEFAQEDPLHYQHLDVSFS